MLNRKHTFLNDKNITHMSAPRVHDTLIYLCKILYKYNHHHQLHTRTHSPHMHTNNMHNQANRALSSRPLRERAFHISSKTCFSRVWRHLRMSSLLILAALCILLHTCVHSFYIHVQRLPLYIIYYPLYLHHPASTPHRTIDENTISLRVPLMFLFPMCV